MEIPVLNRLTELVGDLSSLHQIFPAFPGFLKLSPTLHFWKWGAVIIALLATFSGIINQVKILITDSRRKTSPVSVKRENTPSLSDNLRSSPLEVEDEPPSSSGNKEPTKESDFRVKGTGRSSDDPTRHSYLFDQDLLSWPCLSSCIVKQWENVTRIEAATLLPAAPVMVLSAGKGVSGNVLLRLWDPRAGSRSPAVVAEWNTLVAGDIRKVRSAAENWTECGVDGW